MTTPALKEYLDTRHVKYRTIPHTTAFTAQETAASAHIRGNEMAKTVMIKLDGRLAMVVLPAAQRVNFQLLKAATGAKQIELASEAEFKDRFPECEPGAMPPFGNLYGMEVFVAANLSADEQIAFNAGSHSELLRMSYADFERLVQPTPVRLTAVS